MKKFSIKKEHVREIFRSFNNLNVLQKIKEHSNKLDEIGKTHLSHNLRIQ